MGTEEKKEGEKYEKLKVYIRFDPAKNWRVFFQTAYLGAAKPEGRRTDTRSVIKLATTSWDHPRNPLKYISGPSLLGKKGSNI